MSLDYVWCEWSDGWAFMPRPMAEDPTARDAFARMRRFNDFIGISERIKPVPEAKVA